MATILKTGNFIEITSIAADVSPADIFQDAGAFVEEGQKIKSILFVAGANNDSCVIKNRTASGALAALLATPDVELPAIRDFGDGQYLAPYIDFSEGTFNAGHRLVIELA